MKVEVCDIWACSTQGGVFVSAGNFRFGVGYTVTEWIVGVKFHAEMPWQKSAYFNLGPLWFGIVVEKEEPKP